MIIEQNEKMLKQFAKNVAYLRKNYGLSKKEMADIMKIGIGNLNKLERGEIPKRLGIKAFFRIQNHFNIRVADLFTPLDE